jgi:hypothetical protein
MGDDSRPPVDRGSKSKGCWKIFLVCKDLTFGGLNIVIVQSHAFGITIELDVVRPQEDMDGQSHDTVRSPVTDLMQRVDTIHIYSTKAQVYKN